MHFEIKTSLLRNALTKVLSVIERKNSRPILSYTLFEVSNNFLQISATDSEVYAQVKIEIKSQKEGTFCVNAKNIFEILKELPNEMIDFDLNPESNVLNLTSDGIHYSLLVYNSNDFPRLNQTEKDKKFTIDGKQLIEIINKTSHAISNDETRIYLNGIFLQEVDLKLRAVATDGHRLSLLETVVNNDSIDSLINGVIIPKKGINELKRMAESDPGQNVNISVDDSFLYANILEKYFLSIRLIARDYPKYQAVIPSKTSCRVVADRNTLYEAVKRIKIMSNEKSNQVRINLKDKELTLSANHPIFGKAKEKMAIEYTGKEMEIGFNAKYLIDTLSTLNEGDISLELNNELSPVVIKSQNLPDYLGIIMPLKL